MPHTSRTEVAEQEFVLHCPSGPVPGVLWTPRHVAALAPVVLLGHGGSSHKRSNRILSLADWFTRAGIASLAIDGPFHGDRAGGTRKESYQMRIAAEGANHVLDRMVAEWLATLEAVTTNFPIDATRIGYLGLSMGTRYGLPTAAALGTRVRCAVFGKFGLERTKHLAPALDTTARIAADAPKISAPTLFHMQWNDELFTRKGQLELFDRLSSPDKRLIAFTGQHNQTTASAPSTWQTFIAEHLLHTHGVPQPTQS
ncbi:dienelactone hydrolase [Jatrophihabitans sp. GAS493]|nr:dienelactone hydrolase [Jatrophihabitans sp. GAS493]